VLSSVLQSFDAPPGPAWRLASVAGMLCLVVAYLVNQRGRTRPDSVRYLAANAVGAGVLAAYSVALGEWVFVALEGFWCVASLHALKRRRELPLESAGLLPERRVP
jgi:hypothetical protein